LTITKVMRWGYHSVYHVPNPNGTHKLFSVKTVWVRFVHVTHKNYMNIILIKYILSLFFLFCEEFLNCALKHLDITKLSSIITNFLRHKSLFIQIFVYLLRENFSCNRFDISGFSLQYGKSWEGGLNWGG